MKSKILVSFLVLIATSVVPTDAVGQLFPYDKTYHETKGETPFVATNSFMAITITDHMAVFGKEEITVEVYYDPGTPAKCKETWFVEKAKISGEFTYPVFQGMYDFLFYKDGCYFEYHLTSGKHGFGTRKSIFGTCSPGKFKTSKL
ncbi:MAG TPA: hypothetical protein ENJ95_03510 [Bacteroidetes bacterium]|nr:hypothetical protein [Bacteroidota bacterium]